MPSPESLRRLATLTSKVRKDLRRGGMAINFKYLFRSTAVLARIVEVLADHVATQAENEKRATQQRVALDGVAHDGHVEPPTRAPSTRPRRQAAEN
jgi:hypothetical protein